MEEVAQGKFSCGGCGKTYKWKPELAGKKAKCKCGHVMTVPKNLPVEEEDGGLGDLYALAEEASAKKHEAVAEGLRCPSCGAGLTPGEAMCTGCGFNLKTGRRVAADTGGGGGAPALAMAGAGPTSPILGYQGTVGKKHLSGKEDDVGDNKMIELYVPIGLIIFGLIVAMLQQMMFSSSALGFGAAMVAVVVTTIIDLFLMLIACFVAAKVMDASFGAPGPALLKLGAISLAPEAISAIVEHAIPGTTGWFVAWAVALVGYYALFSYLFDLDLGEVLILVFIIRLVKIFVGGFLIFALLALFLGGMAGGASGLFGGGRGGGGSGKASAAAADQEVQDEIDLHGETEAQAWLDESGGRLLGKEPHADSLAIVKGMYDMGATKVILFPDKGSATVGEIVVVLPKKKEQRQKIFEWYGKNKAKHGWDAESDNGQKYLTLPFDEGMSSGERAKVMSQMKSKPGGKAPANTDE